jgi:hypothetical protein
MQDKIKPLCLDDLKEAVDQVESLGIQENCCVLRYYLFFIGVIGVTLRSIGPTVASTGCFLDLFTRNSTVKTTGEKIQENPRSTQHAGEEW